MKKGSQRQIQIAAPRHHSFYMAHLLLGLGRVELPDGPRAALLHPEKNRLSSCLYGTSLSTALPKKVDKAGMGNTISHKRKLG